MCSAVEKSRCGSMAGSSSTRHWKIMENISGGSTAAMTEAKSVRKGG